MAPASELFLLLASDFRDAGSEGRLSVISGRPLRLGRHARLPLTVFFFPHPSFRAHPQRRHPVYTSPTSYAYFIRSVFVAILSFLMADIFCVATVVIDRFSC